MNIFKAIALIDKYSKCPVCKSDRIGIGQGNMAFDEHTFTRTCNCGFKITVDEDGNKIEDASE